MNDIKYEKFKEYLLKEIDNLIFNLSISLSEEYTWFIDLEQKEYKKSSKYKKLIHEYELSQGKFYGLEKSLNKLTTWESTKGRTTNDPHISYHNKSNEWTESDHEPLGYEPSISRSDYIISKTKELQEKNANPISNIILKSVHAKWTKEPVDITYDSYFEKFCMDYCEDPYFEIVKFVTDILLIIKKHKPLCVPDRSYHIVINDCKVDATIIESNKITTFDINIEKFPNQKAILGKMVGENFTLPNIALTYRIEKIYKSNYSRILSDIIDSF